MFEKKLFTGGMDLDTEERFLSPGDWRYALNVRAGNTDQDSIGAIENVKGNTLVEFDLPSGANTCIGTHEDKENNTVIYFVFNDLRFHSILQFYPITRTIEAVIQGPVLNFQKDKLITGVELVDDKLLYWTDDFNEPGQINIERSKAGGYPTPFTEQYIQAKKRPPLCEPKVAYKTVSARKINNLKGNLYQAKYRYIYPDNEISEWSPVSKVALPDEVSFNTQDIDINNAIAISFNTGDEYVSKIEIATREGNLGLFASVKTFDKELDGISSNTDFIYDWFNDTVAVTVSTPQSNKLFDNVPLKAKALELVDGNRLTYANFVEGFDNEPFRMIASPIYSGNIPGEEFIGEGPSVDHKIYYSSDDSVPVVNVRNFLGIPTSLPAPSIPSFNVFGELSTIRFVADSHFLFVNAPASGNFLPGTVFTLDISYTDAGTDFTINAVPQFVPPVTSSKVFTYTTVAGDTKVTILDYFANEINAWVNGLVGYNPSNQLLSPYLFEPIVDKVPKVTYFSSIGVPSDPVPIVPGIATFGSVTAAQTLVGIPFTPFEPAPADGFNVPKGLITSTTDGILELMPRRGSFFVISDFSVSFDEAVIVESFSTFKRGARHPFGVVYQDEKGRVGTTNISDESTAYVEWFDRTPKGQVKMLLSLLSKPPIWAHKWQIVYAKNTTIIDDPEGRGFIQFFASFSKISFNANATTAFIPLETITNFGISNINTPVTYGFTKGDRIRYIDRDGVYRDLEIVNFDESTNKVEVDLPAGSGLWKPGGINTYEIYTPKKQVQQDNQFYFEIGECRDVGNPETEERYHVTEQTISENIPGTTDFNEIPVVILDQGDVYLKLREMTDDPGQTSSFISVEDSHYSDFYTSNSINIGRPNVVDINARQVRREATIRFSEAFIPDTNINGLNSFFDLNFSEYDKRYGSIQKLYSDDKRLICFQELKVGGVLVNENILFDQRGSSNIQKSDQVLSDIVYYSGEFGIGLHPESFAEYGMSKYFVDYQRGAVLRLGSDGITPVSEYKMHNYWNSVSKDMLSLKSRQAIYGTFDTRFNEYIVSASRFIKYNILVSESAPHGGDIREQKDFDAYNILTFVDGIPQQFIGATSLILLVNGVVVEAQVISVSGDVININVEPLLTSVPQILTRETLSFNERTNRWTSFYSYSPDFMEGSNIDIVTFDQGRLFLHNDSQTYNNFYNTQYTSKMKVLSNEQPSSMKFYKAIEQETNLPWDMPSATNQFGQETSLAKADFENIEGVFWANMLRDINSYSWDGSPDTNPLIEGDDMRCHSMVIEMENDSTEFVKTFSFGVRSEMSERTNR